MSKQDWHPNRRFFLEALGGALGGFVREYRKESGEPSAKEEQELAAAQADRMVIQLSQRPDVVRDARAQLRDLRRGLW